MSKFKGANELSEWLDRKMSERAAAIVPLLEGGRVFLTGTPWSQDGYLSNKHMRLTPELREHIDVMEYTAMWHHPGVVGVDRGIPIYDFPCSCGRMIRGTDRDRGKPCTHATQQPPTLRKWLGNHVHELGRWADVLREQPVPAGWITSWEWDVPARVWRCHGYMPNYGAKSFTMFPTDAVSALVGDDIRAHDAYRMALVTRHPDVKPEPKPAAFPWDPYPEVV